MGVETDAVPYGLLQLWVIALKVVYPSQTPLERYEASTSSIIKIMEWILHSSLKIIPQHAEKLK
ncbi:hypothetical protein NQ318_004354, partial [Aromia moschata]